MVKFEDAIGSFMETVVQRNPGEIEFIQSVQEVAENIIPFMVKNRLYKKAKLINIPYPINIGITYKHIFIFFYYFVYLTQSKKN